MLLSVLPLSMLGCGGSLFGTDCEADLTLDFPDGDSVTLDFCESWSMYAQFEFDPDSPPEVRAPEVTLNAVSGGQFQCSVTISLPAACGEGYYRVDGSSGEVGFTTLDCTGVADANEGEFTSDDGYVRLDVIDAGEEVGDLSDSTLELTLAGALAVESSEGVRLSGDFRVAEEVSGIDHEDALCLVSDGDDDDDGDLAEHFGGDDCDDEDSELNQADADSDGFSTCDGDCDDDDDALELADLDQDGFTTCDGDCDDGDDALNLEDADQDGDTTCDGDCDDQDPRMHSKDSDRDGYSLCDGDCNDADRDLNPADVDGDGYSTCDGDCKDDSAAHDPADRDGDGYSTCDLDCDDGDSKTYPDAPETCEDGVVNDCWGSELDAHQTCGNDDLINRWVEYAGQTENSQTGAALEVLDDIDGDGQDDFLIGAPFGIGHEPGAVYLMLGGERGAVSVREAFLTLAGEDNGDRAGGDLADAGDQDGDGQTDLLIGASGYGSEEGVAYLVHGGRSGTLDLGSADAVLMGSDSYGYAGSAVDGGADVDGDGEPDFLVTAPESGSGTLYLYTTPPTGTSLLSDSADHAMVGPSEGSTAGRGAAFVGDLDGDGLEDMAISAEITATVHVVHGSSGAFPASLSDADVTWSGPDFNQGGALGDGVAKAGDFDGDGLDDILVGCPRDHTADSYAGAAYVLPGGVTGSQTVSDDIAWFMGESYYARTGTAVGAAGDTNGDGHADLVIGASGLDSVEVNVGAAYLVLGPQSGSVDLATGALRIEGLDEYDQVGASVMGAGDFDADGYDDLFLGANYRSSGATWSGSAFLLLSSTW